MHGPSGAWVFLLESHMGRDDFTKKTIDTLADRAGHRCSHPRYRMHVKERPV